MLRFKSFYSDYLVEASQDPNLGKGESTDANGRISEHAFHYAINSYYNSIKKGRSHKQALNDLHDNATHVSNKMGGGSEEMQKHKNKVGKENFERLYSDTIKSAAHFIHHLHSDGYSISGQAHATGAGQERKVQEQWGVSSNADLIVPVRHKSGKQVQIKLRGNKNSGQSAGASLKVSGYGASGKKSSGDKLRGPGAAVIHGNIVSLVKDGHEAELARTPKSQHKQLRETHKQELESLDSSHKQFLNSLNLDKDHPMTTKIDMAKNTIKEIGLKKVDKSGKEMVAQMTRRIPLGSEAARKFNKHAAKIPGHPTAENIHDFHRGMQGGEAASQYLSTVSKSLNKVYAEANKHFEDGAPTTAGNKLRSQIETFHHKISGVPKRKSKERKAIRIFHVSVSKNDGGVKTKVANLPRLMRNAHDATFGRNLADQSTNERAFSAVHDGKSSSFTIKTGNGDTMFSVSNDRRFFNVKSGSGLMPNKEMGSSLRYYTGKTWS